MVKHTIMEDISGETGSVNAELKMYNEKITTLCTKWNDAKTKQKKRMLHQKNSRPALQTIKKRRFEKKCPKHLY